jgi:predicted dehydrogenase/threonine dehydrogenase-like Zn-dependent dehydrogenase
MRQLFQNLKNGNIEVTEIPSPRLKPNHILIQTTQSLISAGTEKMLLEFGKANLFDKARQQPDKVRQVLEKVRTDGLLPTFDAVRAKLDTPLALGYCNVGRVIDIDERLGRETGISPGDRVVNNGPHSEIVCIPKNLCAKIPEPVTDDEAVFTVIGSIALQGIRLVAPEIGENIVVMGLGLIGLMAVQLLMANGCNVIGYDPDKSKCEIAKQFGADIIDITRGQDAMDTVLSKTDQQGVDGVLITASTTSSDPIHQAASMCRKRGRIVLTGLTGLQLNRNDFYEKELSFQVSCSYGPGRYDKTYEEKGIDYPFGYVRWTEQRNFQTILNLLRKQRLNVLGLITHRFSFDDATSAYDLLYDPEQQYIGILLDYPSQTSINESGTVFTDLSSSPIEIGRTDESVIAGLIGAGGYTAQVLLPAMVKAGIHLKTIASSGGASATHLGKKFGFQQSVTDPDIIFSDPDINTVFIATRHDTHAQFTTKAIASGKHVFVEKPLCLLPEELERIIEQQKEVAESKNRRVPVLAVGFNRRFSPHARKIKELLKDLSFPKSLVMTVNAGAVPADHWIHDPEIGGGRIIGEVCHFIDLFRYIVGYPVDSYRMIRTAGEEDSSASIQLGYKDGSIGSIHYFTSGNKGFPKERLEIFSSGKILHLDNFRTLRGFGWRNFKKMKMWRQDKGHIDEIKAFTEAILSGGQWPIPMAQIFETTEVAIKLSMGP